MEVPWVGEAPLWQSSPSARVVWCRSTHVISFGFLIMFVGLVTFVGIQEKNMSILAFLVSLLSLFLWLGMYQLFAAFPGRVVQSVTPCWAVIQRGYASLGEHSHTTILSLYYSGWVKATEPHCVRFTSHMPHVLDVGGFDGASFVGVPDPEHVLALVRSRKEVARARGQGVEAGRPNLGGIIEYHRVVGRSTPLGALAVAAAVALATLSVNGGTGVIALMLGLFALKLVVFRDVCVDKVTVARGGLQLSHDRGAQVTDTVPWRDVFPMSVFGCRPWLPFWQGFRPRNNTVFLQLHKAKAVVNVPAEAVGVILARAMAFAQEEACPTPEDAEPEVHHQLGTLANGAPGPWSHYGTRRWDRDDIILTAGFVTLLIILGCMDPMLLLRALVSV